MRYSLSASAASTALFLVALAVGIQALPSLQAVYVQATLRFLLVVWACLLIVVSRYTMDEERKAVILVSLLSFFATLSLLLLFQGTNAPHYALEGDNAFITSYVTNFAHLGGMPDFSYRGLPSYYPPLYYWVLGKTSSLLGVEPWTMLQRGFIATVCVLPFLTYWLWRPLVGTIPAVIVAFSLLLFQEIHKPAAWLSLTVFVPWWLRFVRDVSGKLPPPKTMERFLLGGLLGGLVIQLQYYWLFVGAVELAGTAFTLLVRERGFRAIWQMAKRAMPALSGMLVFSALYWVPYAWSLLTTPGAQALQNRWLEGWMLQIPLPFLDPTPLGLILLAGLIVAAWAIRAPTTTPTTGVLRLLVAAYAWIGLGFLAILLNRPTLVFRTWDLINYLLVLLALLALARFGSRVVKVPEWRLPVSVCLAGLVVLFGQKHLDQEMRAAHEFTYPREMIETFRKLTGEEFTGKTVITSELKLPALLPVFSFITGAHVSHPAAGYPARKEFLTILSEEIEPELFAAAVGNNRYDGIDYWFFNKQRSEVGFNDSLYPNGSKWINIEFNEALFSSAHFDHRTEGGFHLYRPLRQNRTALDEGEMVLSVPIQYALRVFYGPHLQAPLHRSNVEDVLALNEGEFESLSTGLLLAIGRATRVDRAAEGEAVDRLRSRAEEVLRRRLGSGSTHRIEGEDLRCGLGESNCLVFDRPDASGGRVRRSGLAASSGHLAFGPYETLPPGYYQVSFALDLHDASVDGLALDVTSGNLGVVARLQDLRQPDGGTDAVYMLEFMTWEPLNGVEYRVYHPGGEPIELDYVEVSSLLSLGEKAGLAP